MRFRILLIFSLFTICASAQVNTFYRKYNLSGMQGSLGLISLPDGGFVGTGQHEGNGSAGDCDVYVYRVDACGALVWMRLIGTPAIEGGKSIHLKNNNHLLVVGLYNSKGMIIELDINGNLLWEKRYNNTSWTLSIDECANGDLVVTTMTVTGEFGLMRCDSMGSVLWSKTITGLGDYPITALVQSNGNIFINSTYNIPGKDFSAMMLDSTGNLIWGKTYGGVGYAEIDYQSWGSKAIYDASDSSFVIIGQTSVAGSDDILCAKLSKNDGSVIWSRIIGDAGSEQARDIVKTANGYAIIGNTNSYPALIASNPAVLAEDMLERDILLLNLDTVGRFIWAKTYGGMERDKGIGLRFNDDHTFLINAYTTSPVFGNFDLSMDPLFIRTDSVGVVSCQYNSPLITDSAIVLSIDSAGSVAPGIITDSISASVVSPYFPTDAFTCLSCSTVPIFQASDTVVCVNDTVNFFNITTMGLVCMQKWNIDGILYSGDIDTIRYSFNTPGVYPIKLYSDCGGSTDTFKVNIRVSPKPVCSFTGNDKCFTEVTDFVNNSSISSGSVASWNWDFGDGNTSNLFSPSHTYSLTGNFNVRLSAISDYNCANTITNNVNVYPVPIASFTGAGVCLTDSLHLFNNSLAPFPITSYTWFFDGSAQTNNRNASHLFQTPGSHTVDLKITDIHGCSDIYSNAISVYPMPTALFELPSNCDVLPFAKFVNNSSNSVSWFWDFGDEKYSTDFSPIHQFGYTGFFKVSLLAVTDKGCVDSISGTLEVDEFYNFWIPNAFTPNNDEMNDVFIPKTEGVTKFKMDIYDRWGLLIYTTDDVLKGWDSTINGKQAQEDVYVYRINVTDVCDKVHTYVGHFSLLH